MPDWYDSAANSPDYRDPNNSVVAGPVTIYDPGQIGAGNLPSLHGPSGDANQFVTPDPRRTVPYPGEPALQPSVRRSFRLGSVSLLRGGIRDPYLFHNMPERGETGGSWGSDGRTGVATGSPQFANVPEEHGPQTLHEMEALEAVYQPTRNQKPRVSWWRRLLMLPVPPAVRLDSKEAFPENVINATGGILPGETEANIHRPSSAALNRDNQFVIPDPRRIFDNPADEPHIDKAGYQLTETYLEPIPYRIHAVPADIDLVNVVDTRVDLSRPRAGEALPEEGRRATVPRWFYMRPFDQLMAHRLTAQKGQLLQPLISRPIFTFSEVGVPHGVATAGFHYTSPAPGMEAVSAHPNTDRTLPMPWDQSLVDTGNSPVDFGTQVQSRYAQAGWRRH